MGTVLGLLEKKGLVERKAHPTDGPQINIKLTARGKNVDTTLPSGRLTFHG
jgi:DNA-binding MarR family transcriptional regulator